MQLKKIDICKILNEELSYHSQLASKKKITINHSLEKTLYKIDKEDFIRITNNLLSNAIKYTKRDGEINITLKNSILSIQDNGIGIEKDKLKKNIRTILQSYSKCRRFWHRFKYCLYNMQKLQYKNICKIKTRKRNNFRIKF